MCQKSNVFGRMTHIVNQSISRVEKNVFNKISNKDKMKFQNKYISKYIYICTFNKMWLFVHRKFDKNKKKLKKNLYLQRMSKEIEGIFHQ